MTAAAGLAVVVPAGPALADAPTLVDTETVTVRLTPTGKVDGALIFSQLTAQGTGSLTVQDPTSTKGLRNLGGFGSPEINGGTARHTIDVDGRTQKRTVADYDKELPISVETEHYLDGKKVKPADVVGADGRLEVRYVITNTTAKPTEVTFPDAQGKPVTRTADVVVPFVGSLTTRLPAGFAELEAPGAGVVGDGRGGTVLNWTMILFPPVGRAEYRFRWSADIADGIVPAASIALVPAGPADKPDLARAGEQYKAGARTGSQLVSGATAIDTNLLKVQQGAGDLLEGLTKLSTGAGTLSTALRSEAAPGSAKLADGLGTAAAGAKQLAGGIDNRTEEPDLVSGATALAAGLDQLNKGLGALGSEDGVPAAYAATLALRAGVTQIVAGLGSASREDTVLGGLAQLSAGNSQLGSGVGDLRAGADRLADPATGLPAAKGGVDQVKAGLDAAIAPGGPIDQLKGGVAAARGTAGCSADPVCVGTLNAVSNGIDGSATSLRNNTAAAAAGLGQVSAGLNAALAGIGTGDTPGATTLRGGLAAVSAGLTRSGAGLALVTDGVEQVRAGLRSGSAAKPGIAEGLEQLAAGLTAAITGVGRLAAGVESAGDGAGKLADGARKAGAGADKLQDGLQQLHTGAERLSGGLDAAASGAGEIADGAKAAADGAGQLESGTGQIREQGTSRIIAAGQDTTATFGEQYAVMEALSERARTDALPYGPPKGAVGAGAYTFELAAATGEGSSNAMRGIVAAIVFAMAIAAAVLVRRRRAAGL